MKKMPKRKAPVGSGARFKALEAELAAKPGVKVPPPSIGKRKFAKKRFAALSMKGRK